MVHIANMAEMEKTRTPESMSFIGIKKTGAGPGGKTKRRSGHIVLMALTQATEVTIRKEI